MIFTTAVLTLNFDLDFWKLIVKFGTDATFHENQPFNFWVIAASVSNEPTNEPLYQHTRPITNSQYIPSIFALWTKVALGHVIALHVTSSRQLSCSLAGCLQLLEILKISWNFIDAAGKFNCQLKYDNMPITEPNLVTSLNPEKLSFDHFFV